MLALIAIILLGAFGGLLHQLHERHEDNNLNNYIRSAVAGIVTALVTAYTLGYGDISTTAQAIMVLVSAYAGDSVALNTQRWKKQLNL